MTEKEYNEAYAGVKAASERQFDERDRLRIVMGISTARLRELATAEAEGRVVVLNKIFQTPRGEYGFLYYNMHGLLIGEFYQTEPEASGALKEMNNGRDD